MSRIVTLAGGYQVAIDSIDFNFPPNLVDMFSRLRVSEPKAQVVINQSGPLRNKTITEGEVSGSGTSSTYSLARAETTLTVGTTVGLRRLRSSIAGLYQPGKSLLCFFTFNLGEGQTNVTKRAGYFDDSDGIFLEQNGTTLSWVIRSSVGGSVVETSRVTQANWNKDKFDGTSTGYNFDPTKCHIGFITLEWLGVGDVAVGFVYNQVPVVAHVFQHPNIRSDVYMRTANLFISYEIQRTLAGGTSANLDAICGTLISEGGLDALGYTYSIARPLNTPYNTSTSFNNRVLILFRLNPSSLTSRVIVKNMEVWVSTNTNYYIKLVRLPTFSSSYTPTWTSLSDSAIQYDFGVPNTIDITNTDSNSVWVGVGSKANNYGTTTSFQGSSLDFLGSSFDCTPDVWALVVECDGSNIVVEATTIQFWEQI